MLISGSWDKTARVWIYKKADDGSVGMSDDVKVGAMC